MTNQITTKWLGIMAFESNKKSLQEITLCIDVALKNGGKKHGDRPKSTHATALAGSLDWMLASLIKKMILEVEEFRIETIDPTLRRRDPKYYDKVCGRVSF